MMSIHPKYLSYRKGRKYILEMYNPHRFAWHHGQGSGATFHVLKVNNSISSYIDPSYIAWWDKKMFPQFFLSHPTSRRP
ncbi:hypothetical protein NC652_037372 [Populus alba x Populus x berolinensis]|nr:hypothetical protein NC652_037372 [Populus alba x Populus x berolinensis]